MSSINKFTPKVTLVVLLITLFSLNAFAAIPLKDNFEGDFNWSWWDNYANGEISTAQHVSGTHSFFLSGIGESSGYLKSLPFELPNTSTKYSTWVYLNDVNGGGAKVELWDANTSFLMAKVELFSSWVTCVTDSTKDDIDCGQGQKLADTLPANKWYRVDIQHKKHDMNYNVYLYDENSNLINSVYNATWYANTGDANYGYMYYSQSYSSNFTSLYLDDTTYDYNRSTDNYPVTTFSGCDGNWHNQSKQIGLSCFSDCNSTTYRIDDGNWLVPSALPSYTLLDGFEDGDYTNDPTWILDGFDTNAQVVSPGFDSNYSLKLKSYNRWDNMIMNYIITPSSLHYIFSQDFNVATTPLIYSTWAKEENNSTLNFKVYSTFCQTAGCGAEFMQYNYSPNYDRNIYYSLDNGGNVNYINSNFSPDYNKWYRYEIIISNNAHTLNYNIYDENNNVVFQSGDGDNSDMTHNNFKYIDIFGGDFSSLDNGVYFDNVSYPTTAGVGFTLTTDGNHKIDYNSIDNYGNLEIIKTSYCAIDKTKPTSTWSFDANHWYNYRFPDTNCSCADSTSGCSSFDTITHTFFPQYRFPDGTGGNSPSYWFDDIPNPFYDVSGEIPLECRSLDKAGNISLVNRQYLFQDLIKPTVSSDINNGIWQLQDTNVHLTCDDNLSGPNNSYYYLDLNSSKGINYGALTTFTEHTATDSQLQVSGNALGFAASSIAQGFKFTPTYTHLDYITVKLSKDAGKTQDLNVFLTDANSTDPFNVGFSVPGTILKSIILPNNTIQNGNSTTFFDYNITLDINVTPGHQYFLMIQPSGGDWPTQYYMGIKSLNQAGNGYSCFQPFDYDNCSIEWRDFYYVLYSRQPGTPISITSDGNFALNYYCDDIAGNTSISNTQFILVNKSNPTNPTLAPTDGNYTSSININCSGSTNIRDLNYIVDVNYGGSWVNLKDSNTNTYFWDISGITPNTKTFIRCLATNGDRNSSYVYSNQITLNPVTGFDKIMNPKPNVDATITSTSYVTSIDANDQYGVKKCYVIPYKNLVAQAEQVGTKFLDTNTYQYQQTGISNGDSYFWIWHCQSNIDNNSANVGTALILANISTPPVVGGGGGGGTPSVTKVFEVVYDKPTATLYFGKGSIATIKINVKNISDKPIEIVPSVSGNAKDFFVVDPTAKNIIQPNTTQEVAFSFLVNTDISSTDGVLDFSSGGQHFEIPITLTFDQQRNLLSQANGFFTFGVDLGGTLIPLWIFIIGAIGFIMFTTKDKTFKNILFLALVIVLFFVFSFQFLSFFGVGL